MTYIVECINAWNLLHVCLIIHKVCICLDGCFYLLEVCAFLKFYIHHATMNASTNRNGHGEGVLHTFYGTNSHRVAHRATWTKVCITDAFRSKSLHQCAYDGV